MNKIVNLSEYTYFPDFEKSDAVTAIYKRAIVVACSAYSSEITRKDVLTCAKEVRIRLR